MNTFRLFVNFTLLQMLFTVIQGVFKKCLDYTCLRLRLYLSEAFTLPLLTHGCGGLVVQ